MSLRALRALRIACRTSSGARAGVNSLSSALASSRGVALAHVITFVSTVVGSVGSQGCAASEGAGATEETSGVQTPNDRGTGTSVSELRLAPPFYLGPIASGETKTRAYRNPPRFQAYGFLAKGGDEVTADVTSINGDAIAWITTAGNDILATNDDSSSGTTDAKVVYKVPSGSPLSPFRIVFRDYQLLEATFTVTLSVKSSAPITCSYNGATYRPGDTFRANDDCNTCGCMATGAVVCTTRVCACDPEAEPWRIYYGTPETCETVRYTCTPDTRSFQNACGCGCESPSHTPLRPRRAAQPSPKP